jgi:uroporphyrinogen-III synthase
MNRFEGKTILLTRTADDSARWAKRLRTLGARPLVFPCIRCEPIGDEALSREFRRALDGASWLAVTSRRGVLRAQELLRTGLSSDVKVAAVGPRTAEAAWSCWGRVDLVAGQGTGRSLAEDLAAWQAKQASSAPMRVVVAAAEGGRRGLEEILEPLGVQVLRFAVYRTVPAPPEDPRTDLASEGVDVIFLASPSAVQGLVARAVVPDTAEVISIGPTTTAAARSAGLHVAGEAQQRDLDGLLEVIS